MPTPNLKPPTPEEYRRRAEYLRGEAAKTSDPALRRGLEARAGRAEALADEQEAICVVTERLS